MKSLLSKLVKRNGGFTLTELAVAMVVVGILASIAVPSFLGARNNAFDREAQAAVDAALVAATMHYANNGDFTDSVSATCAPAGTDQLAADLERLDPNFDFVAGSTDSTNPRTISVTNLHTHNGVPEDLGCQAFYATVLSRSGACFVGRLTVEGRFVGASGGTNLATISVNTGTFNTDNASTTEAVLSLNGRAFGGYIPISPNVASTSAAPNLGTVGALCDAQGQATFISGGTSPNNIFAAAGLNADQYYENWRTVKMVVTPSVTATP